MYTLYPCPLTKILRSMSNVHACTLFYNRQEKTVLELKIAKHFKTISNLDSTLIKYIIKYSYEKQGSLLEL